jgi:hypothetical protein
MMRQVIGHSPSAKTIERRTRRVGAEKNSSFERMKARPNLPRIHVRRFPILSVAWRISACQ